MVVVVKKTAATGLDIAVDVVVGDMPGIVLAVVPVHVVGIAQMRGAAGRATGQKPEGVTNLPPNGAVPKRGWGVMTAPEVESGGWEIGTGACVRLPR